MKKLFYVLILIPLLAIQCEKDSNSSPVECQNTDCELAKLPPPTTDGLKTFGCLINGKAWIAKGTNPPSIQVKYSNNELLYIDTYLRYENNSIDFLGLLIRKNAKAQMEFNHIDDDISFDFLSYKDSCFYEDLPLASGEIILTKYDTINNIIAGTFSCTIAPEANACDTLKITHGRFDAKIPF